ncbi:hypothetical protein [Mycobacterium aquaticum]|nr:hypothetical protein [Mycobacterium aquaticum]
MSVPPSGKLLLGGVSDAILPLGPAKPLAASRSAAPGNAVPHLSAAPRR